MGSSLRLAIAPSPDSRAALAPESKETLPMTDGHVLLEMSHIVKEFPGVRALDDVTMRVR